MKPLRRTVLPLAIEPLEEPVPVRYIGGLPTTLDMLDEPAFKAQADKTAVDRNATEEGFFLKQARKIKERLNDKDIKKHTIEDLFGGMQDNVADHMNAKHSDYEKTLEQAKMYDRLHFPFLIPVGFLNSQSVNNIIETHKAKKE